jgi:hypothetical protein
VRRLAGALKPVTGAVCAVRGVLADLAPAHAD